MNRWHWHCPMALRSFVLAVVIGLGAVPLGAQERLLGRMPTRRSVLASQLVTLARAVLEGTGEVRDDQRTRARILMDLALYVHPDDGEVWRLRWELARYEDNEDDQRQALRRYLDLAPADDAAQLEYIRMTLESRQTVDQRISHALGVLDRSQVEGRSKPLQSRLASYCAVGAHEIGDVAQFNRRLGQALVLDQTNQEATSLMYDSLVARRAGPLKRGMALIWRVRANPLDPLPRRELAQLLLSQGAYAQASQHFAAAQLGAQSRLDDQFYHDWAQSLAAIGDSAKTKEAMGVLAMYESAVSAAAVSEQAGGPPPGQQIEEDRPKTQEQRDLAAPGLPKLPLDLELLRLVILWHADLESRAEGSFGRIRNALEQKQAEGERADVDLAWVSAWLGPEGVSSAAVARLESKRGADDVLVRRIRGWAALRNERYAEAIEILKPIADQDPFGKYGLARSYGYHEAADDRTEQLRQLVGRWPGTLAAMLAARDLVSAQVAVDPLPAGKRLVRRLDEWPLDLREPDLRGSAWTTLTLSVHPKRARYLEPITATVTLRNLTDAPLALAPEGPIPSRLFVFVTPRAGGTKIGRLPAIVVDMQRRLRLEPHDSFEVRVRLDHSAFGALLSANPGQMIEYSVMAVLDPKPRADGGVSTGLLGATAAEHHLQRIGVPVTEQTLRQWLTVLDEPDPIERLGAIAVLEEATVLLSNNVRRRKEVLDKVTAAEEAEFRGVDEGGITVEPETPKLTSEQIEQLKNQIEATEDLIELIGQAINERFSKFGRLEQAWAVLYLPRTSDGRAVFAPVFDRAQRSKDPLIRVMYLAVHVAGRSATVTGALRHSAPQVVEFARALNDSFDAVAQRGK